LALHIAGDRPRIHDGSECDEIREAKWRSPSGDRHEGINGGKVRPRDGDRPRPLRWTEVRHSVAAPMIQNDEELERLPPQRMERMDNGDNRRRILFTTCSPLLLPMARSTISSGS
jgi:hypothetical protein